MVRPADAPRRAEEGNPPDLNDRINPNHNNERPRNDVRSRGITRRNIEAVQEPVRDRVITRQIIQNMNRPLRRPGSYNTEHNSMVLRSQTGGVPHNQRETRNQPRRRGLTTVRPSASGMRTAAQQLETLRPRQETSTNTGQQQGTSQDAATGQVPLIQRRQGTMHELGRISTTDLSTPGTSRRPTHVMTRSATRRETSVPNRHREGRVFMPPTYWRPDLEDGSSSDEEDDIDELDEEPIRPCPIFHFSRRMPTPASVLEAARAAEAAERAEERRARRARDRAPDRVTGIAQDRASGRSGNSENQKESYRYPWMRPRRDGSSRVESEEDFVPSGYFPNLANLRSSERRQPAINLAFHSQADTPSANNATCNNAAPSAPALHRTKARARRSKKRRKAAKKGRKADRNAPSPRERPRTSQEASHDIPFGGVVQAREDGCSDSGVQTREDGPSGSGVQARNDETSGRGVPARKNGPSGSGLLVREDGPSGNGVPAREDRPSGSGVPAREDGPSGSGVPAREDKPSVSGVPARKDGPSSSGVPVREDKPSGSGTPARKDGPSDSRVLAREDGPSGSGVPAREAGPSGSGDSGVSAREAGPSGSRVPTREDRPSGSGVQAREVGPRANDRSQAPGEHPSGNRVLTLEERRQLAQEARDIRRREWVLAGRAKSRRQVQIFERRESLRINREEYCKKLRAMARGQARDRREESRFQRRRINCDETGTVDDRRRTSDLPSCHMCAEHERFRMARTQLSSTSGTGRFDRMQQPSTSGSGRSGEMQQPSTSGTGRSDGMQQPSTSGIVSQAPNTRLGKRKQTSSSSADVPLDGEESRTTGRTSHASSTTSIGSEQPSRKKKRYDQRTTLNTECNRAGLQLSDVSSTSTAERDVASTSTRKFIAESGSSKAFSKSMKRKRESGDEASSDEGERSLKRKRKNDDETPSDGGRRSLKRKWESDDDASSEEDEQSCGKRHRF